MQILTGGCRFKNNKMQSITELVENVEKKNGAPMMKRSEYAGALQHKY